MANLKESRRRLNSVQIGRDKQFICHPHNRVHAFHPIQPAAKREHNGVTWHNVTWLNGASSFSVCVNGAGHKGGSEQWQDAPSVDQADLQVAENWFDGIKRVRTSQYWPWNEFCHLELLNYMVQSSYLTCQRAKHYRRQQLSSTSGWCGC